MSRRRVRNDGYNFPLDILDSQNSIKIFIELAGVDKEDISIECKNNVLTVICEKKNPSDDAYTHSEITYGRFSRDISLPIAITKVESIQTLYNNGLLIITIDKTNEESSFIVKP